MWTLALMSPSSLLFYSPFPLAVNFLLLPEVRATCGNYLRDLISITSITEKGRDYKLENDNIYVYRSMEKP